MSTQVPCTQRRSVKTSNTRATELNSRTTPRLSGFSRRDMYFPSPFERGALGLEAGDANIYRYVGNDPVGLVDPSGFQSSCIMGHVMLKDINFKKKNNFTIKEMCYCVAIVAFGLALVVQKVAHRNTTTRLNEKVREADSVRYFQRFIQRAFGDLGRMVVSEPRSVRMYMLSGEVSIPDRGSAEDVLSRFPDHRGEAFPADIATKLYKELGAYNVYNQFSYYNPSPLITFKYIKYGNTVIIIFGKEDNLLFMKVLVIDNENNFKNIDRSWIHVRSPKILEIIDAQVSRCSRRNSLE